MKILNVSSEMLDNIIQTHKKSRDWDSKAETDGSPSSILKSHLSNPEALEFSKLINDLSLEEKKELSALLYLSRGDFDSFESAYKNANTVVVDGEFTAHYLGGKDLSKYIPKSLEKLSEEGTALKD